MSAAPDQQAMVRAIIAHVLHITAPINRTPEAMAIAVLRRLEREGYEVVQQYAQS